MLAQVDPILELGGRDRCEGIVAAGGIAMISGWAVDALTRRPVDALSVTIGGGDAVHAMLGVAREDAVARLSSEEARHSGFVAAVPVEAPPGSHRVALEIESGEEATTVLVDQRIDVVPSSSPFLGLLPRAEQWLCGVEGVYVDGVLVPRDGEDWILELGVMGQICGWAIDTAAGAPVRAVVARAGSTCLSVTPVLERVDVVAATAIDGAERCGFAIPVMSPLVGADSVQLFALSAGGEAYGELCTVRVRSPQPLSAGALPNAGAASGGLDCVEVDGVVVGHAETIRVPRGAILSLYGWAIDVRGPRLASLVELEIPGAGSFEATYRFLREDVARTVDAQVADCGFALVLDTGRLEAGPHRASLRAVGAWRDRFTELAMVNLVVH